MDGVRSGAEERMRILDAEAVAREARTNGVERELQLEREWRTSLQETSICNTEKISQLHQEIDQLKRVSEVTITARYLYCLLSIYPVGANKSPLRNVIVSRPPCKFADSTRARETRACCEITDLFLFKSHFETRQRGDYKPGHLIQSVESVARIYPFLR